MLRIVCLSAFAVGGRPGIRICCFAPASSLPYKKALESGWRANAGTVGTTRAVPAGPREFSVRRYRE